MLCSDANCTKTRWLSCPQGPLEISGWSEALGWGGVRSVNFSEELPWQIHPATPGVKGRGSEPLPERRVTWQGLSQQPKWTQRPSCLFLCCPWVMFLHSQNPFGYSILHSPALCTKRATKEGYGISCPRKFLEYWEARGRINGLHRSLPINSVTPLWKIALQWFWVQLCFQEKWEMVIQGPTLLSWAPEGGLNVHLSSL